VCNRARNRGEPETLFTTFRGDWLTPKPMDNRFDPVELRPFGRAYVVREEGGARGLDVMEWDVLAGQAVRDGRKVAQTNVRTLHLPQWRSLVTDPAHRCLIPLTEFCEWTRKPVDLGDGRKPLKGEMWFDVVDQDVFAVAGFWRQVGEGRYFAMVTCDANALVAPIHPKAMITILRPDDWDRWLRGSYDDVIALQRPYPAELMTVRGPVFPTRQQRGTIV
jgi:putative SOS response-associated peptidase YedK